MLKDPIVQEILMDITDDEKSSIPIIECILEGKTSAEEISEETEIVLTLVRKVLYKMNNAGVISYTKTKDPKTKWEIYSWKFTADNVYDLITKKYEKLSEQIEKYEKLSEQIEKSVKYEEENMFFVCNNGHRYVFEKASEDNFICPKCKGSLEYQENSAIIGELLKEKAAYDLINHNENYKE